MAELHLLRCYWSTLHSRLAATRVDQRGITTLEAVLWIGGLAVLALASVAMITGKVNQATNNIPTGP
jgi:hypothetical protein